MPGEWSLVEVEAIVADYLDMLEMELNGNPDVVPSFLNRCPDCSSSNVPPWDTMLNVDTR